MPTFSRRLYVWVRRGFLVECSQRVTSLLKNTTCFVSVFWSTEDSGDGEPEAIELPLLAEISKPDIADAEEQ